MRSSVTSATTRTLTRKNRPYSPPTRDRGFTRDSVLEFGSLQSRALPWHRRGKLHDVNLYQAA